jgi:hypothetical protein
MINFFAGGGVEPKLARRAKMVFAVLGGCWLGFLWGKVEWSQRQEWCHPGSLTEYECEDQINSIIEQTKKPAVLYYYLPMRPYHYLFRAYMYKYSNRYPKDATWVMINLTQHLQVAKESLRGVVFPIPTMRV